MGKPVIFSAVVLAGGRSSRMGCDKAEVEYRGRSLLAHQVETLKELKPRELFISGRDGVDYASFGLPVLLDRDPDAGPLGGVERALTSCTASLLLVLAVDMPHVTAAFLNTLLAVCSDHRGAVPLFQERPQPLAAFYPKEAHAVAEALLRAHRRAMNDFVQGCVTAGQVTLVPCSNNDGAVFANWNCPADVSSG